MRGSIVSRLAACLLDNSSAHQNCIRGVPAAASFVCRDQGHQAAALCRVEDLHRLSSHSFASSRAVFQHGDSGASPQATTVLCVRKGDQVCVPALLLQAVFVSCTTCCRIDPHGLVVLAHR